MYFRHWNVELEKYGHRRRHKSCHFNGKIEKKYFIKEPERRIQSGKYQTVIVDELAATLITRSFPQFCLTHKSKLALNPPRSEYFYPPFFAENDKKDLNEMYLPRIHAYMYVCVTPDINQNTNRNKYGKFISISN